jgi:UDP-N-acetyl-2-amino-2-deoxyglucuronate dehydrogenase
MRVSLIGCGGIAAQYFAVYRDLDWVRVVSCIDPDPEAARRAAAVFQSSPLATADEAAALAPDVDAVVISTPNHLHRRQAIAAIEAGKHVLLQKPAAATLEDARAIARAAEGSRRTIGMYMSYFDQPLVHDLRDMVRQGRLGAVVHCYARLAHKGGMMWSAQALAGRPTWRASVAQAGGGCFTLLAVHFIHTFRWITGAKVVRAAAFTRNLHSPGIEGEDLAVALLEFDSGAMATLDMAWCTHGEEMAVHGTEGRFQYRELHWLTLASTAGPFEGRVVRYPRGVEEEAFGGPRGVDHEMAVLPPAYGDASNPFNQHRMFLEAARDGRPAPVSIAEGVEDMRVVAAVYESARTGRAVTPA